MKYRKKPVVIEAEQFWPDKPLPFNDRGPVVCFNEGWYVVTIHDQRADLAPGDWVILESRGINAAYPCKPDIFDACYEAVDGSLE